MKIIIFIIVVLLCFCTPGIAAMTGTDLPNRTPLDESSSSKRISSMTSTELLYNCQSFIKVIKAPGKVTPREIDDATRCMGYVEGVHNTINFFQGAQEFRDLKSKKPYAPDKTICFPSDETLFKEIRIVVKYMEDHPEQLDNEPIVLVINALKKAFPCIN